MPVRFTCPECRTTLSVTRRKIGFEVACPKCTARVVVPGVPDAQAATVVVEPPPLEDAAEPTSPAYLDDLSDLLTSRPVSLDSKSEVSPFPVRGKGVWISTTAIYVQAILLLLVAATAFGIGYWLGSVDGRKNVGQQPVEISAQAE